MQAIFRAPHYVVGHRNPDTDAVVSAHVMAWLYRQISADQAAVPIRLGDCNPQTVWLFAGAGVPLPKLRLSCRYFANELARHIPVVSPQTPLCKVLAAIQRSGCGFAAVCADDHHPIGILSDRHPRTSLLLQCNVEDFLGTLLQFHHLISGLPLLPLNHPTPPQISRIEVILHKHQFAGKWDAQTAIIIGDRDLLLNTIHQNPPGAVIFTNMDTARAQAAAGKMPCPCYLYAGSVIQLCSQLSGCFPASAALEESFITVDAADDSREVERRLRKAPDGVVVLDSDSKLLGAITAQMLIEAPTPMVTLVDHSESLQSIEGLDEAQIVAIIDHHRLGDIESIAPLEMDVRPVGSTATVIYQRILAHNIEPPADIARLLLGAIVADTLLLVSPTTTNADRSAATALAALANLDLQTFGRDVLRCNDQLASAAAQSLVTRDCKTFQGSGITFLASQIETVDLQLLDSTRATDLKQALADQAQRHACAFAVLMVTDVLQSSSRVCVISQSSRWLKLLQPQTGVDPNGFWLEANMVSRKKQLIPWILKQISSAS